MRLFIRDIYFLIIGISLAVFLYFLSNFTLNYDIFVSKFNKIAEINALWIPSNQTERQQYVSNVLYKHVRVFCFIITTKNRTEGKALHVNATWAKRCNKHVFVSAEKGFDLPTIDFGLTESRKALFPKVMKTLEYIYKYELHNFDFFLKADVDTYFAMDNLRFLLSPYSPNDALHFGCRFVVNNGYMSGGAGYVFSREAVRWVVEKGFSKLNECAASKRSGEDIEIGACMNALNVIPVDTRDSKGRHRFLPFPPATHLNDGPTPRQHKQYFFLRLQAGS